MMATRLCCRCCRSQGVESGEACTVRDGCNAWYCSPDCLQRDSARHRAECNTAATDEGVAVVEAAGCALAADQALYSVGQPPVAVQRCICGPDEDLARSAQGGKSWEAWRRLHLTRVTSEIVPGRPWVSFASETAVTVSWVPSVRRGRTARDCYELQVSTGESATSPPEWVSLPLPYTGTLPVLSGLLDMRPRPPSPLHLTPGRTPMWARHRPLFSCARSCARAMGKLQGAARP